MLLVLLCHNLPLRCASSEPWKRLGGLKIAVLTKGIQFLKLLPCFTRHLLIKHKKKQLTAKAWGLKPELPAPRLLQRLLVNIWDFEGHWWQGTTRSHLTASAVARTGEWRGKRFAPLLFAFPMPFAGQSGFTEDTCPTLGNIQLWSPHSWRHCSAQRQALSPSTPACSCTTNGKQQWCAQPSHPQEPSQPFLCCSLRTRCSL